MTTRHRLPKDTIDLAAEFETAAAELTRLAEELRSGACRKDTIVPVAALKSRMRVSIIFDELQSAISSAVRTSRLVPFDPLPDTLTGLG